MFADDRITVVEERAVEVHGQRLLVATRPHANTDGLGLDAAGVTTDARGFVTVDQHQRTSNPRVLPPATSPAPLSTSTSPPELDTAPPPARSATPPPSTTAACRR